MCDPAAASGRADGILNRDRTRRVSQTATIPAAFARKVGARPPEPFLEATLAFTHVTARPLAPILPMVSSMGSRALVSRRPAIQATGRLAVAPVGLPPLNTSAFSGRTLRVLSPGAYSPLARQGCTPRPGN